LDGQIATLETQTKNSLDSQSEGVQMQTKDNSVNTSIRIEALLASLPLGGQGNTPQVVVPLGQVFVLTYGQGSFDQDGFAEVYLAGEVVRVRNRRGDIPAIVAALAEFPGVIQCSVRQLLAAISLSDQDLATASFDLPVRMEDPVQTLKHSRGKWMSAEDRQTINTEIEEYVKQGLDELLHDPIQIWSGSKDAVKNIVFGRLDQRLANWGLRLVPNSVSLDRRFPVNLSEIVLQFHKAEQEILDAATPDEKEQILRETGLSLDDTVFIRSAAGDKNAGTGIGLFLKLREKKLSGNPQLREKMVKWLSTFAGSMAAGFVNNLYSGQYSEVDISLSEQVLLASFRNPILALGEYLGFER
jgi:hypothetical protein